MAKKEDKSRDSSARFVSYVAKLALVCIVVLAWVSLLTFSPLDPPSKAAYGPERHTQNAMGIIGSHFAYLLQHYIGGGVFVALTFATIAAAIVLVQERFRDGYWRMLGTTLLTISTSAALYLKDPSVSLADSWSGVLGQFTGYWLSIGFSPAGSWLIMACIFCCGLMLAVDNLVLQLPKVGRKLWDNRDRLRLPQFIAALKGRLAWATLGPQARGAARVGGKTAEKPLPAPKPESKPAKPVADADQAVSARIRIASAAVPGAAASAACAAGSSPARDAGAVAAVSPARNASAPPANASSATPAQPPAQVAGIVPAIKPSAPSAGAVTSPANAAGAGVTAAANLSRPALPAPARLTPAKLDRPGSTETAVTFMLPSADLLAAPSGGYAQVQEEQAEIKRAVLQQTLTDFGVSAEVVGHQTGPVITLFELSLAPGVKVAQIANLATDIARSLAVPGVRIVSPIPGKDTVGVEVPNMQKEIVRIRELMLLAPDADKKQNLPLYLGKDAGGGPIVADLAAMPHMLIAGTTGSGKSVCINTIIVSLLMTRSPQDVKFILVDPKMVEMAAFENLPHLLCPIVNDMRKAEEILEWAATKMDERYELLREANVKNIAGYNRLGRDELLKRLEITNEEEAKHIPTKLPYYVIIIDELADLIMTSSKEVEGHIIRIAQKARAVGIHLILATQRPSVNVVTGLIKSNMPCRISFRVASRQESRIVLDQNGADVLLGQGDMLFLQPGTSSLARAQGTYVDDNEIRTVVNAVKAAGPPQYENDLVKINSGAGADGGGEKDDLFDKAVEIVLASQRGSVSLLQRRLQVGYSRASRIIDQMADAGLLGDYKGSQARECLLTLEDWQAMKATIAADHSGQSAANGEPTSV